MTNNIMRHIRGARRGFTLIETFVAITILLTSIAGPLLIASKGVAAAGVARDQLAAGFLAQEAVEYLRYTRDSIRLSGSGWDAVLSVLNPCINASCRLDARINDYAAAGVYTGCASVCPALQWDENTTFYSYAPGSPQGTRFVRTIQIAPTDVTANELRITVTVTWDTKGTTHSYVVRENLFNWQ